MGPAVLADHLIEYHRISLAGTAGHGSRKGLLINGDLSLLKIKTRTTLDLSSNAPPPADTRKMPELKQLCRERGLKVGGNIADLKQRLAVGLLIKFQLI